MSTSRRRFATISSLGLLLLCLPFSFSSGQTTPEGYTWLLQWYKDRLDAMIPEHRADLIKNLSPSERAIERTISYRVYLVGNVNAFARMSNGRRVVNMSAGFFQVVDDVSTLMAIVSILGHQSCFVNYLQYLGDGIRENSELAARMEAPKPVARPITYFVSHRGDCPSLTQPQLEADRRINVLREAMIGASLDYIIAHEMGHHVLGHVGHERPSLTISRSQEEAADEFAFKRMADAGTPPVAAMPVLLLFGAMGGFDLECEEQATHPAPVRRLVGMVTAADNLFKNDPRFREELSKEGKTQAWNDLVSKLQTVLKKEEAGQ